jgi:hypothetical protein
MMSKDEILKKLVSKYTSEDAKILKEAAYNLALASTTEANLDERAARALRLLHAAKVHQDQAPLTKSAAKAQSSALSVCPICKTKMRTVKLIEDRDAFYCQDHRVVVPFPSVSDEEADV